VLPKEYKEIQIIGLEMGAVGRVVHDFSATAMLPVSNTYIKIKFNHFQVGLPVWGMCPAISFS